MTPASPKTYIVTKDPSSSLGYTRMPVIGFIYPNNDQPPKVITLVGERRLIDDSAVMFPCGMVVTGLSNLAFDTVEDWLEYTPKTREELHNPKDRIVHGSGRTEPVGRKTPAIAAEPEPTGYDISFTAPEFKNNSFWHYDDGEFEFCFILPGGEPAPKQTEKVKKIKRDEMDVLKKTIDVLDLDDVKNPSILPNADPEDNDSDEAGEDDDDGLI